MPSIDDLIKNGVNTSSYYQPEEKPPEDGNAVRGFKRAMYQIPETIGGTVALVGDLAGSEGLRDYGMGVYEKNHAKSEALTRPSDSLTSVLQGEDGANVGDFLAGSAGYVAGQALTALGTGGAGGFIGSQLAKRGIGAMATKAAAEKAAAMGAKMGAGAALFGSNVSQEAGSIYPEALEQAKKEGRTLDAGDKARVIGSALTAAGVETAADALMLRGVLKGGRKAGEGMGKAALREVPGAMAREAATEGVQTGIERYGAGQELTTADAIRDYVDSMGQALVGGGLGGGASVLHAQKVPESGPLTRAANTAVDSGAADAAKPLEYEKVDIPKVNGKELDLSLTNPNDIEYISSGTPDLQKMQQRVLERRNQGEDFTIVEHDNGGYRMVPTGSLPKAAVNAVQALQPKDDYTSSSPEASEASIKALSDKYKPFTLDHAQNIIASPGAKEHDLMIAPHASGKGYTVVPSKWLSLEAQAKSIALQKGDEGRLPGPDREAPSGRMLVDSEGGAAKETYGDQSRTAAAVKKAKDEADAAAARREELGTPVPYGTKVSTTRGGENGASNNQNKPGNTVGNAGNESDQQSGNQKAVQGGNDSGGRGSVSGQNNADGNAGVDNALILNPQGQPFVTEFAAKRRLKAEKLQDTHEVVPADGGGFVVQRKPAPEPATKNSEIIPFARKGDFWNYSGDRAPEIAKALGTTVTKRNGVPMVAIPHHALDSMSKGLRDSGIEASFEKPAKKGGAKKPFKADSTEDLAPESFAGSVKKEIEDRANAERQREAKAKRKKESASPESKTAAESADAPYDDETYSIKTHKDGFSLESERSIISGNGDGSPRKFKTADAARGWAQENRVTLSAGVVPNDIGIPISEQNQKVATDSKDSKESKPSLENKALAPKEDRRKDSATRKKIADMSHDEMRIALLTDDMTQLGNRRAYEESDKKPFQASIDIDSLKWVNDNMGHASGDQLIRLIGRALKEQTQDAYHLSGDEFVAQFDDEAAGAKLLESVRDRLRGAVIEITRPDGTVVTKTGLEFSYGIAPTLNEADTKLAADKIAREASGERAGRGERPSGITERPAEGKQDNKGDAAADEVDHNGTRLYRTLIRNREEGKPPVSMWAVETAENKAKRESGGRAGMGDSLHETLDKAMAAADAQHARGESDKELDRQREEAQSRIEAEDRAIKSDTYNGFLDGRPEMTKGAIRKALSKQYRFDGEVMTARDRVESLHAKGELNVRTFEEPKIKPMSRAQFNRANQAQQDAHDRKMKEAGTVTTYLVNDSELGKIAYNYASHLLDQKSAITPDVKTAPEPAAKQKSKALQERDAKMAAQASQPPKKRAARKEAKPSADDEMLPNVGPTNPDKKIGENEPFFTKVTYDFLRDTGFDGAIQPNGAIRVYHGTSAKNAKSIESGGAFNGFPFFSPDRAIAEKFSRQAGKNPVAMEIDLDPSAVLPTGGYLSARMENLRRGPDGVWRLDGQSNEMLPNSSDNPNVSDFDKSLYADIGAGKSSTDLLKSIAKESTNPMHRELAQALMDAGVKSKIEQGDADGKNFKVKNLPAGVTYTAAYDPKTDTVFMFQPHQTEVDILHELVHAATSKAVRANGIMATQMKALYHHVNRSGEMKGMYGMENHDEFVAEALSSNEFQDKLRAIKAMPEGSRFANAWNWFADLVRRAIGLPTKYANALDQALRFGRGMMDENKAGDTDTNGGMMAATGSQRDAMRFVDQWETDDGKPIYYGKDWLLQPEKELDTSADLQPNGLPMGQVAFVDEGNKVLTYTIRDNTGKVLGTALMQINPRGDIVAIHDIETKIKSRGLGKEVVGAIVASTKTPIRVIQMIPSAKKFWEGLGVYGHDTYDNGALDWSAFSQSDRGRAAGVAAKDVQGRGAGVAAGSQGQSSEAGKAGLNDDLLANVGSKSTVGGAYDMMRSAKTLGDTTNALKSLAESSRKFSLWDRTIGTQFNKATKDADFKRVFDAYNQQTNDIAHYAIEAERQAPGVLQRLESVKDIGKALMNSGKRYKDDLTAVSKALFANIEGKAGVQQKVFTDAELRAEFGLNDAQVLMYKQSRHAVNTSIDRLAQTTIASMGEASGMDIGALRNMDLETTAKLVKNASGQDVQDRVDDILKHTAELKRKGYMPAMRFGQYGVTVTDPNKKGDPLYFEMFESQFAANVAANRLAKEYPGMKIDKSVLNKELFTMFKGVSPETVELFAKYSGMDKSEAYQDYIALAKSSRSSMQRMIERKGIAGFSEDVPRVLAAFITSNARQASMNMNAGEINDAMASPSLAKKGDVQEEAQKLHEYMANPLEEAQRLRGFLFMHFLGGSVASAAVNLTQPILQTTPYLSQFAGGKTAGIMASSAKMAATGNIENAELRAANKRAAEEGLTEPQEIHQLMADASGSTLGSSLRARALTKAWGGFFSISEAFNRRLTFLAAYQTAQGMGTEKLKAAGFDDAYSFAARAIIETQGLYAKQNRPNWARGAIGATLFTFKQFGISYLEFLNRLPPKQKMLALGLLVVAAGVQGLPFAEDIEDLIDTIGQSMGYNTNSKKALRDKIRDIFGEDVGNVLTYGLSTQTGIDLHGRLGMSNMLPGTALFKVSEKDKGRDVAEFSGALGGVLKTFQDATTKAQSGDMLGKSGALATLAPVAIKNVLQGAEMAQTGEYKDSRGRKVQDVDVIDSVVKSLGFQPQQIAAESRRIQMMMQDKNMVDAVKEAIADRLTSGTVGGDQEAVKKAREALQTWNDNNPDSQIRIAPSAIIKRAREMRLSKQERFIKSAPKTQRAKVRAELE